MLQIICGAAALAILIPANAFPGAEVLDWIGLGSSVAIIAAEYLCTPMAVPAREPAQP
jgi:hypothetical protein